jgi:DNA-binding PadR family transcriptional regulator
MSKISTVILGISAVAGSALGYYFTTPQGKKTFNRIVEGANKVIDMIEEAKQKEKESQSDVKSLTNNIINN